MLWFWYDIWKVKTNNKLKINLNLIWIVQKIFSFGYVLCSEETWTGYFVVYISVSSVHKNREFVCVCVWPWFVVGDTVYFSM